MPRAPAGLARACAAPAAPLAAPLAALLVAALLVGACGAPAAAAEEPLVVDVVRLSRDVEAPLPLSLLDERIDDEGFAGAELGLGDNATTGGFLGHEYRLENVLLGADEDVAERVATLVEEGRALLLADLEQADLLAAADAAPDALLFNVRAPDDALRNAECRANVLHLPPSRAMLADALAQYLAWKRWDELALVTGRHPRDAAYAAALERAVGRYGLELVERRDWTREPGARRVDSGHHSAQSEIPAFARFPEHDIVLVADERDEFGEYFAYRTESPRPIAGTQGLVPTAWDRVHEQWGATQIQRRFEALAGRDMTSRDYAHWMAMRAIGEAVTRTGEAGASRVRAFLLSDAAELAGFKGVPLSFRDWNGQLRQPVLLAAPRMLVSVSPQEGFLHQRSELDTLGFDRPESTCERFADD